MSPAKISKLFRAASRKAILTLSLLTTLAYVTEVGGLVRWPPATKRALRVKSNLTSNMMKQCIFL